MAIFSTHPSLNEEKKFKLPIPEKIRLTRRISIPRKFMIVTIFVLPTSFKKKLYLQPNKNSEMFKNDIKKNWGKKNTNKIHSSL